MTKICSLSMLPRFKGVEYLMPKGVWEETVGKALHIDRFRMEGVMLDQKIKQGVFKVIDDDKVRELANDILSKINNCFFAKGKAIELIHKGEAEMIALAKLQGIKYLAIDERTTRILIESPEEQKRILENKLHVKIKVDQKRLDEFKSMVNGLKIIRSVDILVRAYDMDLFGVEESRQRDLLRGILWECKNLGCAITRKEIDMYLGLF